MLLDGEELYLADFSFARELGCVRESLSDTMSTACGSPTYAAPELVLAPNVCPPVTSICVEYVCV